MRIIQARDERVGRGILVRHPEPGEEERYGKEGEGGFPAVEAVGYELGRHADDQGPGHAKVGRDVHDCEGADDPAGEVDKVHDGDEQGANIIGGLDIRDQSACRGVCGGPLSIIYTSIGLKELGGPFRGRTIHSRQEHDESGGYELRLHRRGIGRYKRLRSLGRDIAGATVATTRGL